MRNSSRDVAVALSLANLVCLRIWRENLALLEAPNQYYLGGPPHPVRFLSVGGLVLVFALLFFSGARLSDRRRWARRLRPLGFWAVVGYALNVVRLEVPALHAGSFAAGVRSAGLLVILGMGAYLLARRCGGFERLACLALLAATPFAGVTLSRAILAVARHPSAVRGFATPSLIDLGQTAPPSRRLVILLFDELDYQKVFEQRPPSLALPELDRLREESWFAESAYPEAQWTKASVPAQLSGLAPRGVVARGPAELEITLDDGAASWKDIPTIFSHAQSLGIRSGVTGYYHPYCRLFSGLLTECHAFSDYPEPSGLSDHLRLHYETLVLGIPGARLLGLDKRVWGDATRKAKWHTSIYRDLHAETLSMARRADLGLVYAHYPIPHRPAIYDRHSRSFRPGGEYVDNLVLVDRSVGEIRGALEAAGLWDRTALMITSDHSDRFGGIYKGEVDVHNPSHRVPFLLRLPGGSARIAFKPTIKGAATFRLAVAYLRDGLESHADVGLAIEGLP